MPKLTLCMIVRDEEAMLPDCLASARDVVDRMIVVDTGSSDATRDVIARFGADLVEHTWDDDFAAARNAALEHVDGGYVLILDADERLAPGAGRALRAAVDRDEIDLGMLPLHDATTLDAAPDDILSGHARRGEAQLLPRLLRYGADLRFEGLVHETVGAWANADRRIATVHAPILHYGAAPELREARGKHDRNRRLLERRCELDPGDPIARAFLAAELERAGELQLALDAAREAWRCWRVSRDAGGRFDAVFPATLLGQLALGAGDPDEVLRATEEALETGAHPNLHLLAGIAHEQTAPSLGSEALSRAAEHYEHCLGLAGNSFTSEVMPGATTWQASIRLGTVRLQQGEFEQAAAHFERARDARPDLQDAIFGAAEAALATGDAERCMALVEAPLAEPAPRPDAWLLAARAAEQIGAVDEARLFLERASETQRQLAYVAPHRARAAVEFAERLADPGDTSTREASAGDPPCAFAWPSYDAGGDLEPLMRDFGALLAAQPGMVLCLRHDPAVDVDLAVVEQRLQRAFADHLGSGHQLDIVLVDPKQRPADLAAPGDIAIELPGTTGVRRRFLDELGARRVASPAALEAALRPLA